MKQTKKQSEHVVHFHLNPMLTPLKVGQCANVYGGLCHHVPTLILKTLVVDPWSCEYSHD
jgi:hypothetical protein